MVLLARLTGQAIYGLLMAGFLLCVLGSALYFFGLGWLGGLGWLFILMGFLSAVWQFELVRRGQVVDSWNVLIEEGSGRSGEVLGDAERFVLEGKAPYVRVERVEVSPGLMGGIFGEVREFLVVRGRWDSFRMFIGARDYGKDLDVSWHLHYKPSFLEAVLLTFSLARPLSVIDLSVPDLQDLKAYVTHVHHAVLKAVDRQLRSLNQDPSKIERRSKGFLGVS